LSFLSRVSSGGASPCHLALDKSDSNIYVSNYCSGTLSVIKVNEDGTLIPPSQTITFNPVEVNSCDVDNTSHIHEATFAGDNMLLVNDLGRDEVYQFEILKDGLLSSEPTHSTTINPSGSGPRHTIIHPFAPFAFVINELLNTITSFSFDKSTGALLESLQTVSTLRTTEENAEMAAAELQISRNGKFLYGSNRDLSSPNLRRSSIVVISIDTNSGFLEPIQHVDTLGEQPRHFNFFLDGSWLVVGNLKTGNLVSFEVNQTSGLLGSPVSQTLTVSPTHIVSSW